jgi:glycosyltransferase involved in cell wall biosynthesis
MIRLYRSKLVQVDLDSILAANLILVNSHFSAGNIRAAYGREAKVAYLGVNHEDFHSTHQPKQPFVLSVGAIQPTKGFDFLIEALAEVPDPKRPPLHIIGNSENTQEKEFLKHLATQKNVSLEIETLVDDEILLQRYNQASVVIYSPIREPFGNIPLEAMACGTPVVGVAEGGLRESILDGETGFLTERDPAKFAAAVMKLLEDPVLAEKFGQNGRDYVLQEWTWEKSVCTVEKFFMEGHNQ